jgi:hypothetical protein
MAGFENTTEASQRRARAEADEAAKPRGARESAEAALAALERGEDVDLELVAKVTLVDVMAHGEDKDRVNAARAFTRPRKAKDEVDEEGPEVAPAWLSSPEAAKPVVGGESAAPVNGVAPEGQGGAH